MNDNPREEKTDKGQNSRLALISGAVLLGIGALVVVGIKSRDKIEKATRRGRELLSIRLNTESASETGMSETTEGQEVEVPASEEESQ